MRLLVFLLTFRLKDVVIIYLFIELFIYYSLVNEKLPLSSG